jgi:ABC-type Mn2+/Zn2+ transport system ATPase subunit
MSSAIAIIGTTGTGKTTFVKDRLKNANKNSIYLYDVNNEYTEFYDYPFVSMDLFLEKAIKLKNAVIVFEEATIFFSNKSSNKEITELLVRKRHTKNTIFLIFHSLRSVPRNITDLVNHLIIFKTTDSEQVVKNKFSDDRITDVFNRVKDHKDKHFFEIFTSN